MIHLRSSHHARVAAAKLFVFVKGNPLTGWGSDLLLCTRRRPLALRFLATGSVTEKLRFLSVLCRRHTTAVAAAGQAPTPQPDAVAPSAASPAVPQHRRSRRLAVASLSSAGPSTATPGAAATGCKRDTSTAPTAAAPLPVLPLAAAVPEAATAEAEDLLPTAGVKVVTAPSQAGADDEDEEGVGKAGQELEEAPRKKRKMGGWRREPDPPPVAAVPTREMVAQMQADGYRAPLLPVPNLGYACLNMTLRELKPPIFTSRDCIKRTLEAKGLSYLGELALANCRDLAIMIQWNAEHGIRFFRMSSVLIPWMGTFELQQLSQYTDLCEALRLAGDLARLHGQRLTFHPSHFVKLAAPDDELVTKSIKELEAHSQILDLMGYEPSPENKINIHVGGVYSAHGSKEDTMRRWADNFWRLSPRCRARMTVENDDVPSAFSIEDLLFLHNLCGVPLVFDFHHHKFCPGSLTEKQALEAAVKTWPAGVRPVVHWSESQPGRRPHAHSDYIRGPIFLHGLEATVDVMVEAKCKEQALLAVRGDIPFPEPTPAGEEPRVSEQAALRLL